MPRTNNFDLIRLAAALQVAFGHSLAGSAQGSPLRIFTDMFPGVPIFFFISGFLISKSFEKNSVLTEYALNRFLRIYPGLVVCFLLSLASVWLSGYLQRTSCSLSAFMLWAAAQLSVAQFYNPEFMRHYGLGVLNGSTWTISVELQFYALVPLMYAVLRLQHPSRRRSNLILLCLTVAFLIVNQAYWYVGASHIGASQSRPLWYKFAGVSFAPWFYMFLVGVIFQRNFDVIQRWLAGRFALLLAAYCVVGLTAVRMSGGGFGNSLHPLLFIALSVLIFAAAFSRNTLSDRLLRRNDLSYGVYIYHGPVINLLLATGWGAGVSGVLITMGATLGLAYGSWRLIEKPALALKRHPLYQHRSASVAS
jgi:peptidoglycan/LPS O-acetylase OafA/YrhL